MEAKRGMYRRSLGAGLLRSTTLYVGNTRTEVMMIYKRWFKNFVTGRAVTATRDPISR
ncbi:unnamed protein product [Penicillium camemberti]|uniref:Str. FM013 n=1 Tax=Penicillium camemberti (strain FM 013) TaxID=1429867 RepID=A0A0G4P5J8_PENC3|nr:unnamed protein product [Penicillium camemberti]